MPSGDLCHWLITGTFLRDVLADFTDIIFSWVE